MTAPTFDSYLFESTVRFRTRNYAWTRIESAERSNELILGENPLPPGFEEKPIGQVQAYTFGYDRDFDLIPDLASAVGAQVTTYGVPKHIDTDLWFAPRRRRTVPSAPPPVLGQGSRLRTSRGNRAQFEFGFVGARHAVPGQTTLALGRPSILIAMSGLGRVPAK